MFDQSQWWKLSAFTEVLYVLVTFLVLFTVLSTFHTTMTKKMWSPACNFLNLVPDEEKSVSLGPEPLAG